jgi:hypothetical protein
MRTLCGGKFNTILMGVLIGLQKLGFLHRKTSYPWKMYPHKTNWTQHSNGRNGLLKILKYYKADGSRKWGNPEKGSTNLTF